MLRARALRRALHLGFHVRAAASSPHPKKRATGGEDAYCADDMLLAVADGVGSWAARGVDSGEYARALMRGLYEYCEECRFDQSDVSPLDGLKYAVEIADQHQGSSTALVATISGNTLSVLQIGDCSLLVLRGAWPDREGKREAEPEVVFRTEELLHGFNYPYQLGQNSITRPENGALNLVAVEEHDIVLLGSDGVFDNVFDEDVAATVARHLRAAQASAAQASAARSETNGRHIRDAPGALQRAIDAAAKEIVATAEQNAVERGGRTPVQERAMLQGLLMAAGKPDDTTLVVGVLHSQGSLLGGARTYAAMPDLPPRYTGAPSESPP